jgi:signal transduction histidine kinase
MVYRTAYELINNALKHAEAKTINIELVQQPDSVSLTVQDDGKGFNPEIIKDVNGLQNIKSRVESFNGTMNIISLPGEGTEINVDFKTGKEI